MLGAFVNDAFLTEQNIISILGASAALAMVVLAESLVLITGKFDLSLESVVGIAPAVGALLLLPAAQSGWGTELPPESPCSRSSWWARSSAASTASSW